MENKVYVRNPQSGSLEIKTFADAQLAIGRISDPVAQGIVQGFTNTDMVGDKLFPSLRMAKESGKFPSFGREAFVIPANIKRGVGEKVQRILTQNGSIQMSLSEYALGVGIENRERNEWAGSPDQLLTAKLMTVTGKIALYREKLQATLATTSSNYASGNYASGTTYKWATDGDPIKDLRAGRLVIQGKTGRFPNKSWFTPTAWELLINNNNVKQTLKGLVNFGSLTAGMVTPQMVAAALQVDEVIIASAVYGTPSANGSDGAPKKSALTVGYLWESVGSGVACAGLAYVGEAAGINPSFGYTYERQNSPVIESYYDNTTKSQIWDYEHFFDPAVTMNEAGYLLYSLA